MVEVNLRASLIRGQRRLSKRYADLLAQGEDGLGSDDEATLLRLMDRWDGMETRRYGVDGDKSCLHGEQGCPPDAFILCKACGERREGDSEREERWEAPQ